MNPPVAELTAIDGPETLRVAVTGDLSPMAYVIIKNYNSKDIPKGLVATERYYSDCIVLVAKK